VESFAGNDNTTGAARNRIGQVSHNVVFGTFNLQDQGDGGFPDLNRVCSPVLGLYDAYESGLYLCSTMLLNS
jgi:hypothetical protein